MLKLVKYQMPGFKLTTASRLWVISFNHYDQISRARRTYLLHWIVEIEKHSGPWSSGQRTRLLFRRSEFESIWIDAFFSSNICETRFRRLQQNSNSNHRRRRWRHWPLEPGTRRWIHCTMGATIHDRMVLSVDPQFNHSQIINTH